MCRRNDHLRILLVLIATAIAAHVARADEVSDYLERHGLRSLLAVHLETQLQTASGDERTQLIDRLSDLYAELLEQVTDPTEQAMLEERGQKLLEQVPAARADRLRLTLLLAKYKAAEKVAENHRLRLSSPEEVEHAKRLFGELVPKLSNLRQQIRQNTQSTERRVARATGSEAAALVEAAERMRSLYTQCAFYNAWSLYYLSWLTGKADHARDAEPLFGEIISPDDPSASPEDVSIDLRSLEPVARSILGLGLCKTLTASSATAISWIDLLEHENTFQALREQVDLWRIAVYLQFREYRDVQEILQQRGDKNAELPLSWLRLMAVHALEDSHRSRQSDELAKFTVTQLASHGELQQVLDLAQRYGLQALGQSGFAFRYVAGVVKYQEARQAHGHENPTIDPALASSYDQAIAELRAALTEPDADRFADAAAGSRRLIGWCLYFQSKFLDASRAFEEAGNAGEATAAADSLWMAIVALDRVAEAGQSESASARRDSLIARFLERFPESSYAPQLRLRRAVAQESPSIHAVDELLSIPAQSEVHAMAQRRAAEMLYLLYRESPASQRHLLGMRFLDVALPLISPAARQVDVADDGERQRLIVRCRQVLEVALSDGIQRIGAVRTAFEALEELKLAHGDDVSEFTSEIDCRRVQERLLAQDISGASAVADQLWARDSADLWSRIAVRAMFKHGYQLWKDSDSRPSDMNQGLELVVRFGGRVLHEFKNDSKAIEQPGALGYFAAVAEATMTMWEHTGDAERGRAALFLYDKLLTSRPKHAVFLRATATLAEKFNQQEKALDCWRTLVAGADQNSPLWFEAKFNLIRLLAQTDSTRAREVMNQHKQLHSGYGPEPWGARLKGLDEQLASESTRRELQGQPGEMSDAFPGNTAQ